MKPVMKRNAEKLCCLWFIHFCYCSSCCWSLFLFCFARFVSIIFLCFVLVSLLFFILTYCYIREKLHTHSDASIFFPLYVGPPVRTTAAPGRFFRSLTFPDDLKGLNRVLRTALAYNNFFKIWTVGKVWELFTLPLCFYL